MLGRILSKNNKTKGTVIGGVLGAAIGTAVARENQGDPVALEPGTPVVIALDLPVHVAIADTTEAPIVATN